VLCFNDAAHDVRITDVYERILAPARVRSIMYVAIRVGDEVTADYYVSLAGELRAPTAEEKETPLTIIAGGARAPKDTSPAGGVLRAFKVVATVVGLDLPTQSVTLEGPLGNSGTIRAENVEKLKQLRLGDTVVVTYTEALAISLQKSQPGKTKQ